MGIVEDVMGAVRERREKQDVEAFNRTYEVVEVLLADPDMARFVNTLESHDVDASSVTEAAATFFEGVDPTGGEHHVLVRLKGVGAGWLRCLVYYRHSVWWALEVMVFKGEVG